MALTVRGLIEKLEKVEDKSTDVFIELPTAFLSVDSVFLDEDGDIILSNDVESEHCDCEICKENEIKL